MSPKKKGLSYTRLDFMTAGTSSSLVHAAGFKQERFSMVFVYGLETKFYFNVSNSLGINPFPSKGFPIDE